MVAKIPLVDHNFPTTQGDIWGVYSIFRHPNIISTWLVKYDHEITIKKKYNPNRMAGH